MTGSACTLHAVLPASRFVIEGPLEGWSRINGEGTLTTHYVCATCKTRTHSANEARPGVVIIRSGTLDDSASIVPAVHMYTRSKQTWIGLPADPEAYPGAVPAERLRQVFSLNLY